MAAVEFLAFPGYVHKVLRNDEDDDGDPGTPNKGGLRCRLWGRSPPSHHWRKSETYRVDLAAHPVNSTTGLIDFSSAQAEALQCDAPGFTLIGAGRGDNTGGAFDLGDDYVNRIYLTRRFWQTLHDNRPAFPPIASGEIPSRILGKGPEPYEFTTFIFSNDDLDVVRRSRRYIGCYAEVVSRVGTTTTWNVNVFSPGRATGVSIPIDFADSSQWGPQTQIEPVAGSNGALFLDHTKMFDVFDLPKLPASLDDGPSFRDFRTLVPSASLVHELIAQRGNW
jgi:hypothetical protein